MTHPAALIGAGKKANRRESDYYPTPANVTVALASFLVRRGLLLTDVWEPAAGEGHMADVLRQFGCRVIETDITSGFDFLNYRSHDPPGRFNAIITNPPFALAQPFIETALTIGAPVTAMLLKSQFWHAAKRQTLFRQTRPAFVLPLTWRPDFTGKGKPMMDVCWTIWLQPTPTNGTIYLPLQKPE